MTESSVSQQAYTSMMRFTMDGRPYIKDIHDLFGALMTQIPFATHRYLFRSYPNTFTTEDCIRSLSCLRFSHTVCVLDPNDETRTQRTTTTTTFNMERNMSKALVQQFLWARLMENSTDTHSRSYRDRGIWQIAPKGFHVLQDFCQRTEMNSIPKGIKSLRSIPFIPIERSPDDDQMMLNRQSLAMIFRIMMESMPNEGSRSTSTQTPVSSRPDSVVSTSDSSISSASSITTSSQHAPFSMTSTTDSNTTGHQSSLFDSRLLVSAKQLHFKSISQHVIFSSRVCCSWLSEACTVANRDEAEIIATEFLRYQWIEYQDSKHAQAVIDGSRSALLSLTQKGRQVLSQPEQDEQLLTGWSLPAGNTKRSPTNYNGSHSIPANTSTPLVRNLAAEEGSLGRLRVILNDPAQRTLFKDFLRANFCQENLDFWIDYSTLRRKCQSPALPSHNVRELLEDAYDIWSTYLAPGASSELNVDHALCQEMARVVSSIVTRDEIGQIVISAPSVSQSLRMMLKWFDRVNDHILRLMASDSVPKFIKTKPYRELIKGSVVTATDKGTDAYYTTFDFSQTTTA